ncbi:MAG: extracellular solute-binding protein [Spirochaetales bacterium]|nr:extracellular solute-binding protein [Spirochaetales bacterium]
MKIKRKFLAIITLLALVQTFSFSAANKEDAATDTKEITVITHRTDLVDNLFQEYVKEFNKKYPDIKVNFEAITDYEGEIKIRMNTEQYGDVLSIPKENFPVSDYPDFFIPLGSKTEMEAKYEFISDTEYNGNIYGISTVGNAQGVLYNKEVFKKAGITKMPSTPDEFLNALATIKEKTDAIPFYTNYAAGWTLGGQWEAQAPNLAGDPKWSNYTVPHEDTPWAEGKPYYVMAKLLWDMVSMDLIEDDPTTTDWEACKGMIAKGEIATMLLGSWSIIQMQQAAETLGIDPGVIGYMPFPYTNKDGNMYANVGSDYQLGINIHSKAKNSARLWVDWFTNESGFAQHESGIPALKGSKYPSALIAFQDLGVKFFQNEPSPADEVGLLDEIDAEAEVGRWSENYRMRIVEAAIGNRNETFQDIMTDLNTKWTKARKTLGVK